MTDKITGGCACGAIRYEIKGAPKFSIICQCRQCQRISGSGHAAQFVVNADAATIHGEVKFYEMDADSGNKSASGFCIQCGSPVHKKSSGHPEFLMFHAATLDDPSSYNPEMVVYSQFGQFWDQVNPSLPRR